MDCSRFEQILADFVVGGLSACDQAAAERHLGNCAACRQLLSTAMGETDLLLEDAADDLAQSILYRTSGSVCRRAESRVWDFSAGKLSAENARLMTLHLDHCPGCKLLVAAVVDALQALPAMAEIVPDGSFTSEVIGATSGLRTYQADLWTHFLSWLDRMIKRPHFALEAAYIGALVLAFVFSSPFLPFWNRAFDRISPDVFQPSAQRLTSAWAATTAPVSAGLHETASTVVSRGWVASGSIETMTAKCRQVPGRIGRQVGKLQRWCRKEAASTFFTFSAQMTGFIRQPKT